MRRNDWGNVIKRYKSSGKGLLAFCREEKIPPGSLQYHLKKNKSFLQTPRFIELPQKRQEFSLEWKGLKIQLDQDFDEGMLIKFLRVLAKVC